jgi:hypothetical protein
MPALDNKAAVAVNTLDQNILNNTNALSTYIVDVIKPTITLLGILRQSVQDDDKLPEIISLDDFTKINDFEKFSRQFEDHYESIEKSTQSVSYGMLSMEGWEQVNSLKRLRKEMPFVQAEFDNAIQQYGLWKDQLLLKKLISFSKNYDYVPTLPFAEYPLVGLSEINDYLRDQDIFNRVDTFILSPNVYKQYKFWFYQQTPVNIPVNTPENGFRVLEAGKQLKNAADQNVDYIAFDSTMDFAHIVSYIDPDIASHIGLNIDTALYNKTLDANANLPICYAYPYGTDLAEVVVNRINFAFDLQGIDNRACLSGNIAQAPIEGLKVKITNPEDDPVLMRDTQN